MTVGAWDPSALVPDYGDADAEAASCRNAAALFDFSFVSRAEVRGRAAERLIGHITKRPLDGLSDGHIRYALRQRANGHLVSDLTIWKHGAEHFEVMSGAPGDIADLRAVTGSDARVDDLSATTAILAVQGPRALEALEGLGDLNAIAELPYFGFCRARIAQEDCLVGRLGYTGEPGFEIIATAAAGKRLWPVLAERARPAGLAAIDCLRIEAGFVLFANEFRLPVRAHEIGLERFASGDCIGAEDDIRLICFRANTDIDPTLWRPPAGPWRPRRVGELVATSACNSTVAGGVLGLGFVLASGGTPNSGLAEATGVFRDIERVGLPFYDPGKARPRAPWLRPPQAATS